MTPVDIIVAGVFLILFLGAALVGFKKWVLSGAARGTESSLQLLQQQMEGLRGQLQKELEKMQESFDKVGTQLQYARNNYDEARRRLTDFSRQLTVLSDLSDSGEPQMVLTSHEEED